MQPKELHVLLRISVLGFRAFHACYMFSPKHHSRSSGPGNPCVAINYPFNDQHCASCHGESKENVNQLVLGFLPDDFTVKISRFSDGNLASHVRSVCVRFSARGSSVAGDCDLKICQTSSICRWIESISYRTHGLGDGNEFPCQMSLFLAYSSNTPELSQLQAKHGVE